MLNFKNHLLKEYSNRNFHCWGENTPTTVCDILNNPKPPCRLGSDGSTGIRNLDDLKKIASTKEYSINKEIHEFFYLLIEWVTGMDRHGRDKHESLANKLSHIVNSCGSSRKGWSKFYGKVYRGLVLDARTVSNLKIDINKTKDIDFGFYGHVPCYEGRVQYRSALPAQSWSTDIIVAHGFAQSAKKTVPEEFALRVIMEYNITPDESLTLKYLGNRAEREVIRLSNNPVDVKIHIPYITNPGTSTYMAKNYGIVQNLKKAGKA